MAQVVRQHVSIRAFEPDRFLGVIAGTSMEHYLIRGGPCSAELDHWSADGVTVDRGQYGFEVIARGGFGRGSICVGMSACPSQPTNINACGVDGRDVQFYPEGADLTYRSGAGTSWTAIQMSRERLHAAAIRRLGRPIDPPGRSMVNVRLTLDHVRALSGVVQSLFTAAGDSGDDAESGRCAAAFVAEAVVEAMAIQSRDRRVRSAGREALDRRLEAVRGAQRWLAERLDDGYDSEALCRAVGVPERTLELYFRQMLGLSPRAWFHLWRLHAARRMLAAGGAWHLDVTTVAMRCGFTHLGRFAVSYRAVFGESPSQTLRR